MNHIETPRPRILPPLDPDFLPPALVSRAMRTLTEPDGAPLIFGLERANGEISRYETRILPESHPLFHRSLPFAERTLKFLLWQRGAFRVYVGGAPAIGEYLREQYRMGGTREFDAHFMGEQVYQRPFEIIPCRPSEVPPALEFGRNLGRHLDGCRIGFDLGASDRKVSAVIDGEVVYSEEVIWEPKKHADPAYHYREILTALRTAASKLPRVDAIGGSSAGIYVNNRPMVASLFRAVPPEQYEHIRTLFLRLEQEMGAPLEVINDGDVTALAGSMSIEDNGILGIALGSSLAAGYVNPEGQITGWLNELAFAPVDYQPGAPEEEWSKDFGCGATYFSQQCVFRLAPQAGITLPEGVTDAEKLKAAQSYLEAGHAGAEKIWQTMGVYLGYSLAHFAAFYDIRHLLILGRCTSGRGGNLLLEGARAVLQAEFPELLNQITLHLPDEKIRRVGQAVAAASLPALEKSPSLQ
ncbi:MAG: ROK family protein [Anaerolineales bacterium]|nr:ROK family protein [Anaerolineales bacterium]MCX7755308.1 ROK family protein [Anaerolineales bacterium]MDW8278446.1 ROK family protein [Anaerolineales bacterium]